MHIDLSTWRPQDFIMVGVLIGLWLGNRGRRYIGERVGLLERIVAAKLGVDIGPTKRTTKGEGHEHQTD